MPPTSAINVTLLDLLLSAMLGTHRCRSISSLHGAQQQTSCTTWLRRKMKETDGHYNTCWPGALGARNNHLRACIFAKYSPIKFFFTGRHTHTHTHPFNAPFSGTTRVSRYQKGKTNLDFTEAETVSGSGISWAICKSAARSR